MNYITYENGVSLFNSQDSANLFSNISGMNVETDGRITRFIKDAGQPSKLSLNDSVKWPLAFANGYVDSFNKKYKKQTATPYAVTENLVANLNKYDFGTSASADATSFKNTGVTGIVKDIKTGKLVTPNQAASNMQTVIDATQTKSNLKWYFIGAGLVLGLWFFFIRKKRR